MQVSEDYKKIVSSILKDFDTSDNTYEELEELVRNEYRNLDTNEKSYLREKYDEFLNMQMDDTDSGEDDDGDDEATDDEATDDDISDADDSIQVEDSEQPKKLKTPKSKATTKNYVEILDDDSETDSDYDSDDNLTKFDDNLRKNHIINYHSELQNSSYNEIIALSKVVKDSDGNIVDDLHSTLPILTKFEKTKILGVRTKQLDDGAEPFIKIPEHIIQSHLIAEMELKEKKLPFIIVRPIPNGKKEYWKLSDLEYLF